MTTDDLWDYLHDTEYIIDNEYLNGIYIGQTLYSTDNDVFARDLSEFTELTSFNKPIWEFLDKFYPDIPRRIYLISWTC